MSPCALHSAHRGSKTLTTVIAIQEQIAQLPTFAAVGGERQDALEHILAAISRLSSEVADAVDVLPPYDLRTYTQVVGALSEQVNETIAKLAPKARFKFKSRSLSGGAGTTTVKNQALRPLPLGTSLNAEAGEASGHDRSSSGLITSQPTKGSNERPAEFPTHTIHVAGKCGEHLMLSAPTVRGVSAGSVKDVKRCVVDLRAATDGSDGFASLALKNVTDSLIVAGDVRGPVHVTGLRNSVVVVVAKQVRLHECNEVDIYLHCGSHPIIEDCKTMRFAPAPATFVSIPCQHRPCSAGLRSSTLTQRS